MLALSALYLAVYVSAFAWFGIFFSITSRNTLMASIRSFMGGVFIIGGYWLALLLCCVLPLQMFLRGTRVTFLEDIAQVILGWTPPVVMGWMPLNGTERRDLGFFDWEDDGIGPLSPVLGFFIWFGINWLFGVLSWQAFRRASNRNRDNLTIPKRMIPRANQVSKEDYDDADPAKPSM
jgi:hypothetical protein